MKFKALQNSTETAGEQRSGGPPAEIPCCSGTTKVFSSTLLGSCLLCAISIMNSLHFIQVAENILGLE